MENIVENLSFHYYFDWMRLNVMDTLIEFPTTCQCGCLLSCSEELQMHMNDCCQRLNVDIAEKHESSVDLICHIKKSCYGVNIDLRSIAQEGTSTTKLA